MIINYGQKYFQTSFLILFDTHYRIIYDRFMQDKKLVFIDIDGCLTTGKNKSMPWQYVKALQSALKNYRRSFQFVIITARPGPYAEAVVQFFGLIDGENFQHAICESGAVHHVFGTDIFSVAKDINFDLMNTFEKNIRWLQDIYGFNVEDGRKHTLCVLPGEKQTPLELALILKEYVPLGIKMYVSAGGIDFVPRKINKASAARNLAKKIKSKINQAICIGDSGGDIPLIKIVGHPACPKNASSEVKNLVAEKRGYIAKNSHSLGVAEILEYYNKKFSVANVTTR